MEMVQICEPEAGRNLSDEDELSSLNDLINCQEDNEGISHCQEGNEIRSLRDLIDYQEGRTGNSDCQEGNKVRFEDLINCQERSRE